MLRKTKNRIWLVTLLLSLFLIGTVSNVLGGYHPEGHAGAGWHIKGPAIIGQLTLIKIDDLTAKVIFNGSSKGEPVNMTIQSCQLFVPFDEMTDENLTYTQLPSPGCGTVDELGGQYLINTVTKFTHVDAETIQAEVVILPIVAF